ncbi:MAG TPA: DnaA regulatory inactivator Hda [Casimicrobiaceae bacterium]|nr:DnaA regulatory inactivator Hda [Casimicrobiaceae bacterium]
MEQLTFELAPPEPQRLANFLPGSNGELVAALTRFAEGEDPAPSFLVWGGAATGKTHLLHAAVARALEKGLRASYCPEPASLASDATAGADLLAIDRVDEADAAAAGRIFTAYNALRQRGARMLAAGRTPLAALPLREDLRTRLGWGLVYEALPLSDDQKGAALAEYARQRGFALSAEVIEYLLRHGRRDMGSLLGAVAALDRLSLAAKRPVTVPLLRDWLQATLDVDAGSRNRPPTR